MRFHKSIRSEKKKRPSAVALCGVLGGVLIFSQSVSADTVTSALINKQLDTLQNLSIDSTLPEAMQQIANQTGVRLEANPAVWDLLPWGEQTTLKANIQNRTLRQALSGITQKLALEFVLADESIQIKPMPALGRLGRRATVDELAVLDQMRTTQINLPTNRPTLREIVSSEDAVLAKLKLPFAMDDRAADTLLEQKISVPKNASLADALEAITQQTTATWYPWGGTIVIVSKEEQIRTQLNKTISARYSSIDVSQVLLELFQRAGVDFTVEPGAYQKIPAKFRSIRLMLDDASIDKALETISGSTGLIFDISDQGIRVAYPPADAATTRPTEHP